MVSRTATKVSQQGAAFGVVRITRDANKLLRWFSIMKRLLTTFCMTSILFFSDIKAVEDFRSWTNKDGNSIEAKFIKFKEEQIEIRRRDGFTL